MPKCGVAGQLGPDVLTVPSRAWVWGRLAWMPPSGPLDGGSPGRFPDQGDDGGPPGRHPLLVTGALRARPGGLDRGGGRTMLATDWNLGTVLWAMVVFFFWFTLIWMFIGVFADIFRRNDIHGGAKA